MFDLAHSFDYGKTMHQYQLPAHLQTWIDKHLKICGYNLSKPKELVKPILELSDYYQADDSVTPWDRRELLAAYLIYFFPLNYVRNLKVIDEAKRWGFFSGINKVVDFGCGPGTLSKAFVEDSELGFQRITGVDSHSDVGKFFLDTTRARTELIFNLTTPDDYSTDTLLAASYTLNELPQTPDWLFKYNNLMILEPSTKKSFQKLNLLRSELMAKGFQIWAPCPHQDECPLAHSKKDWCHDRVYWQRPPWFVELEKHLPIKNPSLSFSYLLASRRDKPQHDFTRVVGDALVEKGKTRWLICQDSERLFMSFLKRHGKPPLIYRGDRVKLGTTERKGEEIRIDSSIEVV